MQNETSTALKEGTVINIRSDDDGKPLITKTIKKTGDGIVRPKDGETACVHYQGMLDDGTVFDSSRAAGRSGTFKFTVGYAEVILGCAATATRHRCRRRRRLPPARSRPRCARAGGTSRSRRCRWVRRPWS